MEVATFISENTWVSLSLVIAILGGVAWLTSIFFQNRSNGKEIERLWSELENMKRDHVSLGERLNGLNERMARIETKIDLLLTNRPE